MTTMDRSEYLPSVAGIRQCFEKEIASLGGTVRDVVDDGRRLHARAVLPVDADVLPGDTISAGVAVRAVGPVILVYPYTLRLVCTNGATHAYALGLSRLERFESASVPAPTYEIAMTLAGVRDTVRACAAKHVFARTVSQMRAATAVEANMALTLLPLIERLPREMVSRMLSGILERFQKGGDRSAFGLVNAVTSLARDAGDPEERWVLEQMGGGVLARIGRRVAAGQATAARG